MLVKLIKQLHDLVIGKIDMTGEELVELLFTKADLKLDKRIKTPKTSHFVDGLMVHIEKQGIVTLYDDATSFSIRDGKLVLHAASKRSRTQIMTDYEQVPGGVVNRLVDLFTAPAEEDPEVDLEAVFNMGFSSKVDGGTLEDNPYDAEQSSETDLHDKWLDGFVSAETLGN